MLEAALDVDLADGFRFEAGAPRPMTAETDEGGLRYAILGLLDGREFERIQLDINAVPDDQRPLEHLQLRDLLDFAGIAPPRIPVITVAQHLAEKLHADVRDYGSRPNSRPRDLYDMLVIARSLPIPDSDTLRATCRQTFARRQTTWPPMLPAPPTTWVAAWETYVREHDLHRTDLDAAGEALMSFWRPLLVSEAVTPPAHWDADRWSWSAAISRDVSLGPGSMHLARSCSSTASVTAVRGDRLHSGWMRFVTTGMRRGEVAGLAWDDIDLQTGGLSVNWRLGVFDSRPTFKPRPTSRAGARAMALDPATVESLREHRRHQLIEFPRHLAWSGDDRATDLADRDERIAAYELVLREGTPDDDLRYVDPTLLPDAFKELNLPAAVRTAWQPGLARWRGR